MGDSPDLLKLSTWQPSQIGITSEVNSYGCPTVIYRTPSRLVEECEKAYDMGLLFAALELAVTIPDVCARIAESDYHKWCEKYLQLVNDGAKCVEARQPIKTEEEVIAEFSTIERRGIFTASDLYQLRCAVVHSGSASIDGGKGAVYSPFRSIGVCVEGDANSIIASYGHIRSATKEEEVCAFSCTVKLEGLILRMAEGVLKFLKEDPSRDREYSLEEDSRHVGIVDFRSLRNAASPQFRD